ncbi:MAG: MBL fold metallo-hydrolase [Halobacteriovoraceae bacterium]|nr:MBL fold metallo-hydrolase [Halobacteriovoraceae bacterium]MCB9095575.1 MBL fold metallo-hydrolase [Halobacteriovoraceae bacterium]
MKVEQIKLDNALMNFNYILYSQETKNAWCVDPFDAGRIKAFLEQHQLTLKGILTTHGHWDHTQGNQELQNHYQCSIIDRESEGNFTFDEHYFLSCESIPGHTMDHLLFLLLKDGKQQAAFVGDTLFHNGVGNCKMGGDVELLYESVLKLKTIIDPEARVYPGHDYVDSNLAFSLDLMPDDEILKKEKKIVAEEDLRGERYTFARELKTNLFLNCDSEKLQKHIAQKYAINIDSEKECFMALRKLRDRW